MSIARAFAPATVSNVGCGFDVFGFAVEGPGDTVEARGTSRVGVTLLAILGDGGVLPLAAAKNTAGVAAARVLAAAGLSEEAGVELVLHKGMPLASGLGSSAASAVASAVATDAALGSGLPRRKLLECAVEGERMACGAAHGDNAAPCLYGGFVLVRRGLRVDSLPVPEGLTCALARPHLAIDTGAARAKLPASIPLSDGVRQWGNTAALVAGLFRGDWELLASAVEDAVAEPYRRDAIAGFDAAKRAALEAGALACGISGSGPTLFAFCRGEAAAAARAMAEALQQAACLKVDTFTSPVGAAGARLVAALP